MLSLFKATDKYTHYTMFQVTQVIKEIKHLVGLFYGVKVIAMNGKDNVCLFILNLNYDQFFSKNLGL